MSIRSPRLIIGVLAPTLLVACPHYHAPGHISVEEVVTEIDIAFTKAAPYLEQLPELKSVTISLQSALAQQLDGSLTFVILSYEGSREEAETNTLTITLERQDIERMAERARAEDFDTSVTDLHEPLIEAIKVAAKAAVEARDASTLDPQKISTALSFKLTVSTNGGLESIDVLEATGSLKASHSVSEGHGIAFEFKTAPSDEAQEITEEHAPGVAGQVRTVRIFGQDITYEVIDGLAIYQGDIVLGDAAELEDAFAERASATTGVIARTLGPVICHTDFGFGCATWANGVIGYAFADDWGSPSINDMMRVRIVQAIRDWERETSLEFVRRSRGERVVFKNGGGCSSGVGRVQITGLDPQSVSLSTNCSVGNIRHEIGHAVGFWHEQARLDRDHFVVVDFGRVQDGKLHNFFTHVGLGAEAARYDYDSLMHYRRASFARNPDACNAGNLGECTIRPLGGVGSTRIGQRNGLSEGDILGAYVLYPPRFMITGATNGEVDDHFELRADFDTEPVRPNYIRWRSDRLSFELGAGDSLTLNTRRLPNGPNTITAQIIIFGRIVAQQSVDIVLQNTAPTVDLGDPRDVDLNRVFSIVADVSDAEDGRCPAPACTYTWDPTPRTDRLVTADFLYTAEGSNTLSLTVTDGSGASSMDSVRVNVVNSGPEPVIHSPMTDASYSIGASGATTVGLSGSATDLNEGSGPGPGAISCERLAWSSTNAADVFDDRRGCRPAITFTAPGVRTIGLTATDSSGASDTASVDVSVTACTGNCPPDVSFVVDTAQDFNNVRPGFYLTTTIRMTATINDSDMPPNNPISYRWVADPPCLFVAGCGDDEILLSEGTLDDPAGATAATRAITWLPADDVTPWGNCVTIPLKYVVRLEVRDNLGGSKTVAQTISLGCSLF